MAIPVQEASPDSIESLAYDIAKDIETREPNDRNRLGYHVYLYLSKQYASLEEAVTVAQARTQLPTNDVYSLIVSRLKERGYSV